MSSEYIRFFDTTLRDGEQSPGASLTSSEKLEIARALTRLGVDVIEAGFPAASPDDFQGVQRIAREIGDPKDGNKKVPSICGLARALEDDINTAWEAIKPAVNPRLHTFLATSPVHMEFKLGMEPEEVVQRVGDMVSLARSLCSDVEFSPEDAARSDPEFLYRVLDEAIKAGATTLNIPDTVGYATPEEYQKLITGIIDNTPGIEKVVLSVHCHDDLGLATANTLAGIQAGARQVEVTVNGAVPVAWSDSNFNALTSYAPTSMSLATVKAVIRFKVPALTLGAVKVLLATVSAPVLLATIFHESPSHV